MFEDKDFPTDAWRTLFFEESSVESCSWIVYAKLRWLRPKDIWVTTPPQLFETEFTSEPLQGCLGDCWLIAACYALSKNKLLLKKVFAENRAFTSLLYAGQFHIQLWDTKAGSWITVEIDDRLPTIENKLVLGSCAKPHEFWLPLLEKACAKFYGSYEALSSGQLSEGFMLLTGGYCWQKKLSSDATESDAVTKQLQFALKNKDTMFPFANVDDTIDADGTMLIKSHYYVIKNLFPTVVAERKTIMVELLNLWKNDKAKNKSTTLFVPWRTLRRCAAVITFATTKLDTVVAPSARSPMISHNIAGCWEAMKTSGGRHPSPSFGRNPQYVISISSDTDGQVFISLIQQNARNSPRRKELEQAIGLHVWEVINHPVCKLNDYLKVNSPRFCCKPFYQYANDISLFCTIPSTCRHLLVVASTYEANVTRPFLLRICTSCASTVKELDGEPWVAERLHPPS